MTTKHDAPTQTVVSWLREDAHENAERVLISALNEIEQTQQRRAWWPAWRFHDMNTFAKVLVATAAVLAVAFVSINVLSPSGGTGTGGQPAPSLPPTPTPSPSAPPTEPVSDLPISGSIDAGTYRVPDSSILITIPSGWDISEGSIRKHRNRPGELSVSFSSPDIAVYPDACANDVVPPAAGPTTDDLLAALRAQKNSDVSEPVADTVGQVAANRVEISVPEGLDLATCFERVLRIWTAPDTGYLAWGEDPTGTYPPASVYIAETPAGRVVFDFDHASDATDADVAELDAIVGSMEIESAP